jgi:hypothetical protein
MHPSDRTYRNQTLRLADLVVLDDVIEDVTFENCELVGPAVIVLLDGSNFQRNTFTVPSMETALWHVPDGQEVVVGAVGLLRTTVVGCVLRRIGLAVLPGQEEILRAAFTSS